MADTAIEDTQTSIAAHEKAAGLAYVWDPPTRLFHWALAGCVAAAWWTGGSGEEIHEILGYTIAGLVAFRIFWGFTGTKYAKFKSFAYPPFDIYRYLTDMLSGKSERHLGHNPAGGLMVFTLILVLVTLIATGIMMHTIMFFGVSWVEQTHEYASNVLIIMIPLHVLGVLVSSLTHRENLLAAMLSGYKKLLPHTRLGGAKYRDTGLDILQRIRGSEGLVLLVTSAFIGGIYGWSVTSGREVIVYNDPLPAGPVVSAARSSPEFVSNVQSEPKLIVDGQSKQRIETDNTQSENQELLSPVSNIQKSRGAELTREPFYPTVQPKHCIIHLCGRTRE